MGAQVVDTDKYDVVCVSPRNHFVFTPMLPSSAIGTVEFRSLLEPIRISNPFVTCAFPRLPLRSAALLPRLLSADYC